MTARNEEPKGLPALIGGSSQRHPLWHAVGGITGVLETVLPGFLFVILYAVTGMPTGIPWWALGVSAGVSVVFTLYRIVRRQNVTQAIVGLLGVAASVVLVVVTGRPENNFLWGIILNSAYGLAFLISLVSRWPLVGVVVALFQRQGSGWRKDRESFRVYMWTSVLWLAMFVVRIAVETPLYLLSMSATGDAHQALVTALSVTKIVLGLPLYVPVLAATWLIVRGLFVEKSEEDEQNRVS